MKKEKKQWSFSAGRKRTKDRASSAVRVYEREGLPGFFMTCAWDTTASGRPQEVKLPERLEDGTRMTRDLAKAVARLAAAKRELGIVPEAEKGPITLGDLFEQYHGSADAQDWSEKHRGDAVRARDFWLIEIGKDTQVQDLTKARVAKAARDARERSKWGVRKERKLLAYIRAATRWGCDQAELFDFYPLRGLRLPAYEPDVEELIYSVEETAKLLRGHAGADWRDVLAVNVAADTGRRISAILSLTTEDILTDEAHVYLRFRREFDKGERGALVPISARTAELLALALEEDVVSESGWLFPEGRLDYNDARDKPRSKDAAIDGLRALEALAEVPSVDRRAFHGLKRTHVTASMEESHGDTALVGDITGNVSPELIQRVYRRASRSRSREQVERVRKRLEGSPEEGQSTRQSTRSEEGSDATT